MSQSVLTAAVNRVCRAARADAADAELVTRFSATADPDAFAQLVRRHGPMVLAVCRRITRHRHDAEDAFQATFLVLARRAGELDPPGAVGGWLFGVAVNTARAARRRSARRHTREALTAAPPEAEEYTPEPDFDTRAAIAEAVAELPERYRTLVVACDLRGEPQPAVARQLGVPVGTVYSRLSTARRLLAERLRRRGVEATACAAALGTLAPDASALPPVSDYPSASVTELTEAIMARGSSLKWKLAACVLLVGVTIGFGAEPFKPAAVPAPAPRPADESRLVLAFDGHVRFLKSDGTEASRVTGAEAVKAGADIHTRSAAIELSSKAGLTTTVSETFGPCGRAAPDGRLPLATRKGLCLLTPGPHPVVTPVKSAKGDAALFASGQVPRIVAWSPDGKKAVGARFVQSRIGLDWCEHTLIDLAGGSVTELKLPRYHRVLDWAPDGTWFLTAWDNHSFNLSNGLKSRRSLCKVSADGKTSTVLVSSRLDEKPLSMGEIEYAAVSPDGTRVVFQCWTVTLTSADKTVAYCPGFQITVLDLARNAHTTVVSEPGGARADGTFYQSNSHGVRWSPDGKRIGFFSNLWEQGPKGSSLRWRASVVGADGTGAKEVFTADRPDADLSRPPVLFDWR